MVRRRPGTGSAAFGGFGEGGDPFLAELDELVASVGHEVGYLPKEAAVEPIAADLTDSERIAVRADGGELAALLGEGPAVTEPTHRLTDLPPGVIGAVLRDGLSFPDAMEIALRVEREEQ